MTEITEINEARHFPEHIRPISNTLLSPYPLFEGNKTFHQFFMSNKIKTYNLQNVSPIPSIKTPSPTKQLPLQERKKEKTHNSGKPLQAISKRVVLNLAPL